MTKIKITDLEVFYRVGVPEAERAKPQRLLISVELAFDFSAAATSDRIEETIDYQEIARDLLEYGQGRSWKLIERVTAELADRIMARHHPDTVTVEVKKFPIPQARHVSVIVTRPG
jgi:dihydroneopterin aldolase